MIQKTQNKTTMLSIKIVNGNTEVPFGEQNLLTDKKIRGIYRVVGGYNALPDAQLGDIEGMKLISGSVVHHFNFPLQFARATANNIFTVEMEKIDWTSSAIIFATPVTGLPAGGAVINLLVEYSE